MANVKITALTGISSADVDNEDVFVVVDLSADETKKITLANVIAAVDTDTNEVSNVVALQGGLEGANSNQVAIATFANDTGTWQAGNLIPKANGVYSLGAADALWKDVFISAGSIKLGGVTISAADDEGITIEGVSGDTTSIVTPTAGGASNVSANIALLESNVSILLGSTAGQNTRIASEEANVINLQTGLAGANTALTNEIAATNVDVTNLVTGIGGSNSRIAAEEANVIALQSGISGSNSRIVAEEANVIALQAGLTGANTNISSNDTDITNLVTGLGGSNTNITALEARRVANTLIFDGAFTGSNTRISAEEANVIALQGGIAGANTAISGNDTDITNLITGLDGANTTIATKAATTYVDSQIAAIVDSAPETLNTLNELAAALGDDANFATTTATQIGTISSNTVNLQTGITGSNTNITANETRRVANTLIFLGAFTGSNARISAEEANVIALQGGIAGANTAISNEIAATNTDITNLVTGLDGSNTTIATKDSVANVYATYLVAKGGIDGANTNIASNDTDITNLVTGLGGANTNITAVEARRTANIAGAVSSITTSDLTASRAVVSDGSGKIDVSAVTATELGYLDGVTSAIQTQLDGKQASGSYLTGNETITLSGDVSGSGTTAITVTIADDSHNHVISNIDNLQTSLDAKDTVANVYATYLVAKGGIDGANTNISSNDTDITNLVTGLGGSNTTIATKDSVANVYATYLVAKGGIDGANTNITALEARRTSNIAGAISSVLTSDLTASRALQSGSGGKIEASAVTATELGYLDGVTSAIQTQLDGKQASGSYLTGNETITLSGDVSGSGTTSITVTIADDSHNHVISNIDNLQTSLDAKDTVANVYATYLVAKGGIDGANTAIDTKSAIASPTFTGVPAAPTAAAGTSTTQIATTAFVGTAVANIVDSAPEALNTLNELAAALGDDANFSATVSTQIGTISSNTVTNATNITAVESRRAANVAGAVSSITTSDLTASRAIVSDGSGKVAVSAVTSTELGYLDGVTSAIQTQLDGKQASGSYLTGNQTITLSGDVSGSGTTSITVTVADDSHNHIISNIDGLQTALDAKLASASYTAADVLTKIKTVDGAGSGLDADLLDGQSSAYYAVESTRSSNAAQLAAGIVSAGSSGGGFATVTSTEHTTGTYNSYAIGITVSSVNNVFVSINGVSQRPTEYVLGASGANVQFKDASLASGLDLELRTIS